MKAKQYSYTEWLNAGEMHEQSKNWFSELAFMRGEQRFLNNLIKSYTMQLLDSKNFEKSKLMVNSLLDLEKKIVPLFKQVQLHGNQLEIMVDDVNQLEMEKAYIVTHRNILSDLNQYVIEYRTLKKKLFRLVTGFIKKQNQKKLLNEIA